MVVLALFISAWFVTYSCVCVTQDNDEKLGNERLLKMARGVAQGMDYLSTIGFVHRVRPPHIHHNYWAPTPASHLSLSLCSKYSGTALLGTSELGTSLIRTLPVILATCELRSALYSL